MESRNRRQRERVAIQNFMHKLSGLVGIGVGPNGSDEEEVIENDPRSPVMEYNSSFY